MLKHTCLILLWIVKGKFVDLLTFIFKSLMLFFAFLDSQVLKKIIFFHPAKHENKTDY